LAASTAWRKRLAFWTSAHETFDVVIIGGGVQGACLYHQLASEGRRVLLADRGDFASGTSQASAMLVWGGLLYLKNLDLPAVIRLCAARDRLIRNQQQNVEPRHLTFLLGDRPHHHPWLAHAALWLYWLLGQGRRSAPVKGYDAPERSFLRNSSTKSCLRFEEGHLRLSDAQFSYDWIARAGTAETHNIAMNYCEVVGGAYQPRSHRWRLELVDPLTSAAQTITTRAIVNAAGAWVDRINAQFQIDAPWRHLLAKGASITFQRPADHHDTLVFDATEEQNGMSLVPWGPVSLWGSTERMVDSADRAWQATPEDVTFLLDALNQHLVKPLRRQQIIALRCGVRALAAPRGQRSGNPLEMSKGWRVWRDPQRPWLSIYGGKLTACQSIAHRAASMLRDLLPSPRDRNRIPPDPCRSDAQPEMDHFGGLSVPSAIWCREHQMCWTLDDFLRRRTNIAQWIPRGGFGRTNEHAGTLLSVARHFVLSPQTRADEIINAYQRRIRRDHDQILEITSTEGGFA
jgi:glycerol-3-phosphate dehydrogenase